MKWFLVRHGEIESNLNRVYAGWSEEELTPWGRRQAREAAELLAPQAIGSIYASPVTRAVQTAEIIGEVLKKSPGIDECFKELRLGIWQGKSEEEIFREFPEEWKIWNTKPVDLVLEGRETLGELQERVLRGIVGIKSKSDGSPILVVTHVAIIRILLLHVQKKELNLYKTIHVPNGKIFELDGL